MMNSYPEPDLLQIDFDPVWHCFAPTANVLEQPGTILINPTNQTPVMGAGLALKIKKRWPKYGRAHEAFQKGRAENGVTEGIFFWKNPDDGFPYAIISCPTKRFHYEDSALDLIRDSFNRVVWRVRHAIQIDGWDAHQTVMVPKLGCGLGGLEWKDVLPVLMEVLREHGDSTILKRVEWVFCGPPLD